MKASLLLLYAQAVNTGFHPKFALDFLESMAKQTLIVITVHLLLVWGLANCSSLRSKSTPDNSAAVQSSPIRPTIQSNNASYQHWLIYFKSPRSAKNFKDPWQWTSEDQDLIQQIGDELKKKGVIQSYTALMPTAHLDNQERLIEHAQQQKAQAILVIDGQAQLLRRSDDWAWSQAFMVPTFIVPEPQVQTQFRSEATLLDLRSSQVLFNTRTQANNKEQPQPGANEKNQLIINKTKKESLTELMSKVRDHVDSTVL